MTYEEPENAFPGESPLGSLGGLLASARQRLAGIEVEGSAGGGAVTVSMDGERRLQSVHISPEAFASITPAELEELVLAAASEAWQKADEARLGAVSGMFPGLNA